MVAQGKVVEEFEHKFSKKCGCKYGIAVNSGTAALHLILLSLGIGVGDEVICTSFSFIATASPIVMCGAKPVFVDIEPDTYNIDPLKIEELLTDRTKAIIGVNLFGKLASWNELQVISKKNNLFLLEDSAQSHFARRDKLKSGNFGHASWFSFYATKNMMTAEGGMITTNDHQIFENARRLRQHGMSKLGMYDYDELGFNYRTTDINAALGLAVNSRRIEIAKVQYFREFSEINLPLSLVENTYITYTIVTSNKIREKPKSLKGVLLVGCI